LRKKKEISQDIIMERIQDMFAAREILLITQDTLKKGSWRYISRKRRYKRGRREKIRRAMGKKSGNSLERKPSDYILG